MTAAFPLQETAITPGFVRDLPFQHITADTFPTIRPIHWLTSHFAVGGWSPLQRLSGMLTAHMTRIAPQNGFTWHPHRGLEIYTWVIEGQLYHEDTTGGKGVIKTGEIQRMFSGDWIEHQELNPWDEPARVIQIWFIADRHHQGLPAHYQQAGSDELPARRVGDATVWNLIGDGSPLEQHMKGRLSAMTVDPHGTTRLEAPHPGESLFWYVTDGSGNALHQGRQMSLGQYDVALARPDMEPTEITAGDQPLHALSFYLPTFL
ncbi:MAG TPA: pirin family protein [Aggregatilineales bacterium]|nr:pirin family protein [Aggregatilineales bacterium]